LAVGGLTPPTTGCQHLLLATNAGLFIKLTLFDFSQHAIALALSTKTLEGRLNRLAFFNAGLHA